TTCWRRSSTASSTATSSGSRSTSGRGSGSPRSSRPRRRSVENALRGSSQRFSDLLGARHRGGAASRGLAPPAAAAPRPAGRHLGLEALVPDAENALAATPVEAPAAPLAAARGLAGRRGLAALLLAGGRGFVGPRRITAAAEREHGEQPERDRSERHRGRSC